MSKLMFVWIGSGRAKRRKVGEAGQNLDKAAKAGLPVPPGAILLDEFYRFALENELAVPVGQQRVVIPEPVVLYDTLFESARLPRFDRPLLLRPVTDELVPEPDSNHFAPGPVDSDGANEFCHALAATWNAFGQDDAECRHDVLLQEVVPAVYEGTAISDSDDDVDIVEYRSATDEPATTGNLARLGSWRMPHESLPPHAQRLQMLLRGVRRTMGRDSWTVTWADDGQICWLTGLDIGD
ncbi:MAG: hypothetical protein R3C44_02785 [Chloroflexota bacterium]